MGAITLPNFRTTADVTMNTRLKDGGVSIDWAGLTNIKAWLFSDAQKAIAGRCDVSINQADSTLLVCEYSASKPQYLGVNRLIVQAKYQGRTKTYDVPVFNFVSRTAAATGTVTIDDPTVDVEIVVEDVSSSILDNIIAAALDAAARAEAAAQEAEHMVDIHTGPEGKSAYEVAVAEGYTGTEEEWLASLKGPVGETPDISIGTVTTVEPGQPAGARMGGTPEAPVLNLSIPKGAVGSTPNLTVGTVTTGAPGTPVVVTITGTAEAPVLNITIPQGMQGNTGSSVAYPFELVNNLTTDDATKALSAAQGKVLDGKVTELEAKVTENAIPMTAGFIPCNFPAGTVVDITDVRYAGDYKHSIVPVGVGDVLIVTAAGGSSPKPLCTMDKDYKVIAFLEADLVDYKFTITDSNIKYVLINDKNNDTSYFIGSTLVSIYEKLGGFATKEEFDELSSKVTESAVPMTAGYIPCNVPAGTVVDITDIRIAGDYKHSIIPVGLGDELVVNAAGGAAPKPLCAMDKDYKVVEFLEYDLQNYKYKISNANTKYVLINDKNNDTSYYIGATLSSIYGSCSPKVGNTVYVAASNSSAKDKGVADFVCDGTNDEVEINSAIASLEKGGTVQLLDGDYYIDAFTKANNTAIEFGYNNGNARVVKFQGTTQNKGYNSRYGVTIHITETALNSCSTSSIYRVFSGSSTKPQSEGDFFTYTFVNNVVFENFYLYLYNASKPIIGIYGGWFGSMEINQVGIYTESYFNDRFNHLKPATPHQYCCGVYTNSGSNDEMSRVGMYCVNVGGLYTGFMYKGADRLVMQICQACRCVYGYRFQESAPKPITMINCSDEGSCHLPRFEGNGGAITMIDFNIEVNDENIVPTDVNGDTEYKAKENYPGSWKGSISFTKQGTSRGINRFWADGSGLNFITRNLYNPISSAPSTPEYLERYFDSTENKWKTWNGSAWV